MIPGDDPSMHGAATRALRRLHPELADQGPIQRAVARRGFVFVKTARGNEVAIPMEEVASGHLTQDPAPAAEEPPGESWAGIDRQTAPALEDPRGGEGEP